MTDLAGDGDLCPCGQPATESVIVHWADGDRTYRYCLDCSLDVTAWIGGTEHV